MKYFSTALLSATALVGVIAQETPGPSPTESIGCEPHGDHWHCDGPVSTEVPDFAVTSVASLTSQSIEPSPTESVGCEPHGDHWHCDGPAESSAVASYGGERDDDHQETGSSISPSPTQSVGCIAHGDHWHCEGPASTFAASSTFDASSSTNDAIMTPASPGSGNATINGSVSATQVPVADGAGKVGLGLSVVLMGAAVVLAL